MKFRGVLMILLLLVAITGYSQSKNGNRINQFADLAGTIGSSRGTVALSYVYNWKLGNKQKWEAGLGIRSTTAFGVKQEYTTAPARLARSTTIPFVIVFAGQETKNWDTLTVQRPLVNSVNISANFGYNFSSRWSAGFNIDLLGFTFGRKTSAILTNNGITKTEMVSKPAAFNLLLTGDLDYGNLNSEFFVKYKIDRRWSVRGIYQFYFSEYKTTSIKQIAPDGTAVNRFRQKGNNFGAGLSYNF
ncbi:MAG: hypothetical protein QM791_01390 [Ferruginibacter sp.]